MNDKIRIVALGGLDEEGKNLICVDITNDLFVVSCGVMEPDKSMPGIDYIIPRYEYLLANKSRIKAYFLTHGHNDELGALPYIIKDCPAPVYGSKVTLEMLRLFSAHVKVDPSIYDFHPVEATSTFKVAGRTISYFHTAHNIADSSGIAISTSYGNIVFSGDYVIENAANKDYLCDLNAISRLAETPTLALLTESVYASRAGYTAPLYKLSTHVEDIFKHAEGRIFVSLYSTNLYNVDEVIQLTKKYRRKIVCYDAATLSVLQSMQNCGVLSIPKENFASLDDILRYRDQDLVVLMMGFGSKLLTKIALLASSENEDKRIKLKESDTFIVASLAAAATEREFADAADELFRTGCKVTILPKKEFLKMHASEEDLKMMISLLHPQYYVPVKGFYKDLMKNARIALSMGVGLNFRNVIVLYQNGISFLIDEKGGRLMDENIVHGDLNIDGSGAGEVTSSVLEERVALSNGLVIAAITVDKRTKRLVAGPDIQIRGFVTGKEADLLIREIAKVVDQTARDFLAKPIYNLNEIKQNVYMAIRRVVSRSLTNRAKVPLILPCVAEVE